MAFRWPWQSKDHPKVVDRPAVVEDREHLLNVNHELFRENQLLHDKLKLDPSTRYVLEEMKRSRSSATETYIVAAAFSSLYSKIAESRKQMIKEVDRVRNFYLTEVLLNQLVDDALTPEIGTGRIINVTSDKEHIQREIDRLNEQFGFDEVINSIKTDLIAYGEYTISTDVHPHPLVIQRKQAMVNGEAVNEDYFDGPQEETDEEGNSYGLVDLRDDVDIASVVPLTKWSETVGFLVRDKDQVVRREPADYVLFSFMSQRLRVDLHKEFGLNGQSVSELLKDIPRYIRVGKSVIYPVIAKLKELELLEAMVPATKLSKLSGGTLIGVKVPVGYDVEQALQACEKVEGLINKKVGIDPIRGELTIENIFAAAGKLKCIPVWGDQGELEKIDHKLDEPDDLMASNKELREIISTSIGVPPELIFGGADDASKGGMLRKYARYLRKLKSIQKAIGEGIRQIVYIHLANKNIRFESEDISVEFFNRLIETDNLDRLEFIDTTVSLLDNLKTFIFELAGETSPIAKRVKLAAFVEFISKQLAVVGLEHFIDVDGDGEAEGPFEGPPAPVTNRGGEVSITHP